MKQAILLGGNAKARCLDFVYAGREDVEIWDMNFIHTEKAWVRRIDRMFHIHRYELLKKYGYPCYQDAIWASDHPRTRIILADHWPDGRMARAEVFPREAIARAFPDGRNDYHCNSLDWIIAYALYEQFEVLCVHGFKLEQQGVIEQMSAAKCAEYWAGYAEGKGMKIIVNDDSAMFGIYHPVQTNRVYGYDDCPAWEDRRPGADDPPYRYDDY